MTVENLFKPAQIGALTIKNRFVRSATSESVSRANGTITEDYANLYLDIARGGAGLIFTGHIYVHPRGRYIHYQAGIHNESVVAPYKQFTDRIHDAGGTIFAELGHAGSQSRDPAVTPLAPSPVENFISTREPTQATDAEIKEVIEAFAAGARRVREAGFDGVHVHAGHGYLISEFSSPYANLRDDDWGGDAERRGRFVIEIYRAIRREVGSDYPVTFKLGMADSMDEGGLTIDESVPRAVQLEEEGLDALEVSVGIMHLVSKSAGEFIGVSLERALQDMVIHRLWTPAGDECYFRTHAQAVKKVLKKIPVILVGGIRHTETMADIVTSGDADFISMARPFIREPDLPNKIKAGKRGPVDCVSCNVCLDHEGTEPTQCWRIDKRMLLRHAWWVVRGGYKDH